LVGLEQKFSGNLLSLVHTKCKRLHKNTTRTIQIHACYFNVDGKHKFLLARGLECKIIVMPEFSYTFVKYNSQDDINVYIIIITTTLNKLFSIKECSNECKYVKNKHN
jgi:hypothetical protein